MLVKLLSRQIPEYMDLIDEALNKTLPQQQLGMRADIYQQLLAEKAHCWLSNREGTLEAVLITRMEKDEVLGGKILTLLSLYAPDGLTGSGSILDGFETLRKFATAQGCDRLAFYTTNVEIEKYIDMFEVLWATRYYQLNLEV